MNRPRLSPFSFSAAEVPLSSVVEFVRDPTFKATVVSDTEVEFEGTRTKLSPLVKTILERLDASNQSGAYHGPKFFTYEDEILADRRRRLSESEGSD